MINQLILGNCLEYLKKIRSETIDMVFADPPFNLNKKYVNSTDFLISKEYLEWSYVWLEELVRVTKPSGSIFIHNIPKWLTYYSAFLNDRCYFKHWICWDAGSTPVNCNLQPNHYGILYYAKSKTNQKHFKIRQPHVRDSKGNLLKDYGGKIESIHPFGNAISDIWTDIHRIKHKKYRDEHPCQLPVHLIERIILLSTDKGDLVLDPFLGTGTTAIAAQKLDRNYLGIEISEDYLNIAYTKLNDFNFKQSKLGESFISVYNNKITTIRDCDWQALQQYFNIPLNKKELKSSAITLK